MLRNRKPSDSKTTLVMLTAAIACACDGEMDTGSGHATAGNYATAMRTGGSSAKANTAKGGNYATGGRTGVGGTSIGATRSTTGGTATTGGSRASGGSSATGGSRTSGGSTASGGTRANGGSVATGGFSNPFSSLVGTGGIRANGGTTATGGQWQRGGAIGLGGAAAVAGSAGIIATFGGATPTGGTHATGGVIAYAGGPATGGTNGSAGSAGNAGVAGNVATSSSTCFDFTATVEGWKKNYASVSSGTDATIRDEALSQTLLDDTTVDWMSGNGYGGIPGYVQLTIPFLPTQVNYQLLTFSTLAGTSPLSLKGKTITAWVMLQSGMTVTDASHPSGAKLAVKTGADWFYAAGAWQNLTAGEWVQVQMDIDAPYSTDASKDPVLYDPSQVVEIDLEFYTNAVVTTGIQPGVVAIDHVCY